MSTAAILLQKPGPPMMTDEVAVQIRDLVTKGVLGLSFILTTDDCRKTYEALKAKGVEFSAARWASRPQDVATYEHTFYHRGVGLTWTERPGGYLWDARDAGGRFFAHVSRLTGDWYAYVTPWGSGVEGGASLGPFSSGEEAMAAADRHVADHAAEPPR